MSEIKEKIQRMNGLAKQIIEISIRETQSSNDNFKYRLSVQKQQRQSKSVLISELMTLIAECRKMKLNQNDKAGLDAAITRLNKKLYEATSLVIL